MHVLIYLNTCHVAATSQKTYYNQYGSSSCPRNQGTKTQYSAGRTSCSYYKSSHTTGSSALTYGGKYGSSCPKWVSTARTYGSFSKKCGNIKSTCPLRIIGSCSDSAGTVCKPTTNHCSSCGVTHTSLPYPACNGSFSASLCTVVYSSTGGTTTTISNYCSYQDAKCTSSSCPISISNYCSSYKTKCKTSSY